MSRGRVRLVNILLFIGAFTILGLARWLEPDPSGVGTHIQLGLDPCVFLSALKVPCPMCGMTTTFSLMMHLSPVQALMTQPFGALLSVLTVVIAITSGLETINPRERWTFLSVYMEGREVRLIAGLSIVWMASWAYKIAQMSIFLSAPA